MDEPERQGHYRRHACGDVRERRSSGPFR
jgi:hypothetical protein